MSDSLPEPTADVAPPIQQPATTTSSSSSARGTGRATHTISVAPKQSPHAYEPRSVQAEVGDEIVFEFYPSNHSVVRADFNAPCVPATHDVFFSGHFELNSYTTPKLWSWTVDTTEPIFFYCTGIGSCTKNGMVGAINANDSMPWEKQYNKALQSPFQLEPGEHPPAEGSEGRGPPNSSPTNPPASGGDGHSSLSGGAIAGIVVGAIVGIAILGALFYLLGRLEIYRKWRQSEDGTQTDRTRRWALTSGGGGGLGGWSTGAKSEAGGGAPSEMGTTAVGSQAGHMSYISSENNSNTPYNRHLSVGYTPSSSPPPMGGWDRQGGGGGGGGGGGINGMMEPQKPGDIPEHAPMHELSGVGTGAFVELEAGPYSPPAPVSSPSPNIGHTN
ncbi:hypothetical protein ACJ72_06077 [Emergomyces africanus]|uniref:Phytocyanin domain-containing protein n=1 Tax=Emergomyces africanus TaxID=1955775 RepID=A0A1B7NS34_9EURO|nr:hypothetical protein ACJ72_06077 [Emergomyces africanus]